MESASLITSVRETVRKEVPDWDDEVAASSRFKDFSGQRSDWEGRYFFWRDLILSLARHFRLLFLRPSDLRNQWFLRPGGLSPLCLDHVLFLMCNEGHIIGSSDLIDPKSSHFSYLFLRFRGLMTRFSTTSDIFLHDYYIVASVLKDKGDEVVHLLSQSHWTCSCVVTMRRFQNICGGANEASAVLSYLSGCGRARYLSINRNHLLEGVKVSLSSAAVSSISNLDRDVLHLISTTEKFRLQLDVIDQRYEMSRKSALASLKSRNKKVAIRHVKELKMLNESREKWASMLNRVEEVLNVIADAESTKTVTEAIKIGARAIKENSITMEEVELGLQELEESIDSHKQVENTIGLSLSCMGTEDEDIEEEFKKLELELGSEKSLVSSPKDEAKNTDSESLIDAFSKLELIEDDPVRKLMKDSVVSMGCKEMQSLEPEVA